MRILFVFIFYIIISYSYSQEICNDGIDNNNNGLIDMNDPECFCSGIILNTNVPSLIPNHSFELMNCCPSNPSQMHCATSWIQATSGTSDYLNTCNFVFPAAIQAGLVPFPDGNGIVGSFYTANIKEYVGTCLTAPLIAGNTYVLTFHIASFPMNTSGNTCGNIYYSPVDITIYGNTNCNQMPVSTVNCPSIANPTWIILSTASYTPTAQWEEITFTFTPNVNTNAIILGPPCTLPADYSSVAGCYAYFLYDGLLLNDSSAFSNLHIVKTGNYCTNNLLLSSQIDTTGGIWQWYLNGIALIGETDSVLDVSGNSYGVGLYTVSYSIQGACQSGDINVVDNTPIVTLSFSSDTICAGNSVSLTVSGADSYLWSNLSTDSIITVNPTTTTTYSVTGTNIYGCSDLDTLIITVIDANLNTSAIPDSICLGSSSTLSVSGADSYLWSNLSTDSIFTINPTTTTTYTVTGTDSNGCSGTESIIVTVLPSINAQIISNSPLCVGNTLMLNTNNGSNYAWNGPNNFSSTLQAPIIQNVNLSSSGLYNVSFIDANGCVSFGSLNIVIEDKPLITLQSNSPICAGNRIQLQASGGSSYMWNGPNFFTSTLQNPFIDNSNIMHAGIYTVTVSSSLANCQSIDSLNFEIIENLTDIFIPNVFTPDGDALNDIFKVVTATQILNFEGMIFNRWGDLIFKWTDINEGWDGSFESLPACDGVYFYVIKGKNECNEVFRRHGSITILR